MPETVNTNNCGVSSLSEMKVTCSVINPSTSTAANGSITAVVEGGTPPYEYEWSNGSFSSTIYGLKTGEYTVKVTDDTGDYTVFKTCSVTPPSPPTTISPSPSTTVLPDSYFCLTFDGVGYYLEPNSIINGKKSWKTADNLFSVFWDNTLTPQCWRFTGSPLSNTIKIINANPSEPPIGSWTVFGSSKTANSKLGECVGAGTLSMTTAKVNPTCTCDGSITLTPNGGTPPYEYSFITNQWSSFASYKNNLCSGNYTVKVRDSLGAIVTDTITLAEPQEQTTYAVSLERTKQQLTPNSFLYTFQVVVDKEIPEGCSLTFNLTLQGTFLSSPNSTTAVSTFTPTVDLNGTEIPFTQNNTTEPPAIPSVKVGCQTSSAYLKIYSYKYQNLTYTSSSNYQITVSAGYSMNCVPVNPCCDGKFTVEPVGSLNNVKIIGCDCSVVTYT